MKTGRPIKFYRTLKKGSVPPSGDIQQGEIALNLFAGEEKIYVKNSNNDVIPFYSGKRTEAIEERTKKAESAISLLNTLDTERGKEIQTLNNSVNDNAKSIVTNSSTINTINGIVNGHTKSISTNTTDISTLKKRIKENSDAIAAEKTRAEGQEALKLDKDHFEGFNEINTLTNIPVNKRLVFANISGNSQISFSSVPASGQEIHVIVKNTAKNTLTIPIPNSGTFISTGTDSMVIPSGSYGEINVVSNGIKLYIRCL